MVKILTTMPTLAVVPMKPMKPKKRKERKLRIPQIRILRLLATLEEGQSMTRTTIRDIMGSTTPLVGQTIGYSDPIKRAARESSKEGGGTPDNPNPSLLTFGYVTEYTIDVDGFSETHVQITPAGRAAIAALEGFVTPPFRRCVPTKLKK